MEPNCKACDDTHAMGNVPCPECSGDFEHCRGCGKSLVPENQCIADGCPCNSPRGINHGLVPVLTCTCPICDPAQTGSVRRPVHSGMGSDLMALCGKVDGISGHDQVMLTYKDDQVTCEDCRRKMQS